MRTIYGTKVEASSKDALASFAGSMPTNFEEAAEAQANLLREVRPNNGILVWNHSLPHGILHHSIGRVPVQLSTVGQRLKDNRP